MAAVTTAVPTRLIPISDGDDKAYAAGDQGSTEVAKIVTCGQPSAGILRDDAVPHHERQHRGKREAADAHGHGKRANRDEAGCGDRCRAGGGALLPCTSSGAAAPLAQMNKSALSFSI